MVDISQLVQGLTNFLAPFMPYLVTAGQAVAGDIGNAAWEQAQKIWSKLHPKVVAKPAALEAAQDVAAQPDNPDARAALRQQLAKLLADDPALVSELQALLTQAQATVIQNVGGSDNTVVGGDQVSNVTFNQPNLQVGGEVNQAGRDLTITNNPEGPKQP